MKLEDLKPDPNNPRWQSPEKAKALARALYEFGDLGGIVENVRTGELVGGHQRVAAFRGDPEGRVEITETLETPDRVGTVAYGFAYAMGTRFAFRRVSWSAERARAANVVANSPELQGDWSDTIGATLEQIKVDFPDLSKEIRIDELPEGIKADMGQTPYGDTNTNRNGQDVTSPWDQVKNGERVPVRIGNVESSIAQEVYALWHAAIEQRTANGETLRDIIEAIFRA